MRILLQQKDTRLYCQGQDAWTARAVEAVDFLSSTRALEYCAAHNLRNVDLVLKFEGQPYDLVMPITSELQAFGTTTQAVQPKSLSKS